MITIGVDAHKQVHVAVAVDEAGRKLDDYEIPNKPGAWQELYEWAYNLGDARQWGVEGSGSYGRGLAQHLVVAEEVVFEVNPRLTAAGRRRARRSEKTDGLDAHSVAMAVLREGTGLPQVIADDETAVLDLLTTERETLVVEASGLRNRIHMLLMHIDPEYKQKLPKLTSKAGVKRVLRYSARSGSALQQEQAAMVRRHAKRMALALEQADELERQIEELTQTVYQPLTELSGVSLLTAGALAGILGPEGRFERESQLAAYSGAAPLETSSAGKVRHRLNRSGNRRFNAILYRIVLTQSQRLEEAKAYLKRRMSEGKTRREAIRALKRYIVRAVWRLWQRCLALKHSQTSVKMAA